MKVLFRPEAEDELVEAIDWYDVQSPGLGAPQISFGVSTPALGALFVNRNRTPSSTAILGWLLFDVFYT